MWNGKIAVVTGAGNVVDRDDAREWVPSRHPGLERGA